MPHRKEIKYLARMALNGSWVRICSVSLTELLARVVVLMVNMRFVGTSGRLFVFGIGITIILSLLADLLTFGLMMCLLAHTRGKAWQSTDVFRPFLVNPDRYLLLAILGFLAASLTLAPELLASVSGFSGTALMIVSLILDLIFAAGFIFLMIEFSMSAFVLIDNPEETLAGALKKGYSLIQGHKGRLFVLVLSFIGWIPAALMTLGIGLIWIRPYFLTSLCLFYRALIGEDAASRKRGADPDPAWDERAPRS